MRILQINTVVNSGSTGRITEEIGETFLKNGHESFIAYGRGNRPSKSQLIKIGNSKDILFHVLRTRFTDRHGFGSKKATKKLVKKIQEINPEAIGLHNIHGYYINIEILFNLLKEFNKPVVWTLHDCWAFTGHCAHFARADCYKWQTQCYKCPLTRYYPTSFFIDNSRQNFNDKKRLFTGLNKLHIVSPSKWLANHIRNSFLSDFPVTVINNGIDLNVFKPFTDIPEKFKEHNISDKKTILGVSNIWTDRKGFYDFMNLSDILDAAYKIVLVGLTKKQISKLPKNIIGITRTENVNELAEFYSAALVFVNPTYSDNFPTTNLEALACGTPVITYNTGGSPETIDNETGIVVEKGNINALAEAIKKITSTSKSYYSAKCRARAEQLYNKNDRYMDYLKLYEKLIIQ